LAVRVEPPGQLWDHRNGSLGFFGLGLADVTAPDGAFHMQEPERFFVLRWLVGFPRESSQFTQAESGVKARATCVKR